MTLPIGIVIPHSSLDIPPELEGRIALTPEQIFNEADAYTDLIYDFRERVLHFEVFPYARSIIDMNRPNEAHPLLRDGDGIVKRKSSYGATVFKDGQEPDEALEQHLIQTYWQSWHDQLDKIIADERVKLVLDCHSMAALGPSNFNDPAQVRPRITASNMGDAQGNPRADWYPLTASPEVTRLIGEKFGEALEDIPALAPTIPAQINEPFAGGWDIHLHRGNGQAWLMIELSRAMYIGEQTGDSPIVPPDETRIALIRERLWTAIEAIVATL